MSMAGTVFQFHTMAITVWVSGTLRIRHCCYFELNPNPGSASPATCDQTLRSLIMILTPLSDTNADRASSHNIPSTPAAVTWYNRFGEGPRLAHTERSHGVRGSFPSIHLLAQSGRQRRYDVLENLGSQIQILWVDARRILPRTSR